MEITWWHWLLLGLVLIALEMAASGGFYVIFFGIAAVTIAALRLFDVAGPLWIQVLLFSVISVASMLLFRKPLLYWMGIDGVGRDVDSLVGEIAVPLEDILPAAVGRAELRGSVWSARSRSGAILRQGQRCTVVGVHGLMVFIEPEGASS